MLSCHEATAGARATGFVAQAWVPLGARFLSRRRSGRLSARLARCQRRGSRPISRVLWGERECLLAPAAIPLAPRSPAGSRAGNRPLATYPRTRPSRPRTPAYLVLLRMEVAAFHPRWQSACGTRLCGPVRRVATPGCYPAPCSVEPGLSSPRPEARSGRLAGSRARPILRAAAGAAHQRLGRPQAPGAISPASARRHGIVSPARKGTSTSPSAKGSVLGTVQDSRTSVTVPAAGGRR